MADLPPIDPGTWWDTLKPFIGGAGPAGALGGLGLLIVQLKRLGILGRKQDQDGTAAERAQLATDNAAYRTAMREDLVAERAQHVAEIKRRDEQCARDLARRDERIAELEASEARLEAERTRLEANEREGWDRLRGMQMKAHALSHDYDGVRTRFNALLTACQQVVDGARDMAWFAAAVARITPYPAAAPVPTLAEVEPLGPEDTPYE